MNKHSQYTTDRLETIRRAKNRTERLIGTITIVTAVLFVLLTVALIDYWLLLPLLARAGGAAVWAGLAAIGSIHLWRLIRRPADLKAAALELEGRRPELGCVVSTAAEYLSGERSATQDYEPELVDALQEQAAKRLLLVETRWYRKKIVQTAGVLVGALAAIAVFLAIAPAGSVALRRAFWPWTQEAYTRIEVEPGNIEIPEGRDQEITTLFRGRAPKNPQLYWRTEKDPDWQMAALTRTDQGTYVHSFKNLRGTIKYRVAANDAVSPVYTISTFIPPEIKQLTIKVDYPAYTKQNPVEETTPNLSFVRGSHLTFRITASGELEKARLRFANQPGIGLKRTEHDEWTAALLVKTDVYYWVELTDKQGRKGGNEKPYHLTVLPDEPPHVAIFNPGMDIRADATDKIPLKISVADDFGVRDVKLVFRKVNGPEGSVVCVKQGATEKDVTATAEIDLAPLHLKEYELVAYHAEAADNNTLDGPGIGKSPVYFIEYTTKEKALSQCNGNSQKINLLEIQKQIIAATTAVKDDEARTRFPDISSIQRQTKAYAEIFQHSFLLSISPPEARTEFAAAIQSMSSAATALDAFQRGLALRTEDEALEHLYQVTRLLPELEAGMCRGQGQCIKIVLEAIERLKENQKKERLEQLSTIINQVKRLAQGQAKLNDIYRAAQEQNNPQSNGKNTTANQNRKTGSRPGQVGRQGQGRESEQILAEAGGPNDEEQQQAKEGAGERLESTAASSPGEAQKRLGDEASELAAKLRELAGKDPRVGNRYSRDMRDIAANLNKATDYAVNRDFSSAGLQGGYGLSGLTKLISALEILYQDNPQATDLAEEEYPKEFEAQIANYLKRLSYEQ